jgi:hypothetical protein
MLLNSPGENAEIPFLEQYSRKTFFHLTEKNKKAYG